jgi:membrane carboxypeptidase/penicillin-binding protein
MKRAIQIRQYSNAKEFPAPDGVVTLTIDPQSGMPATPNCPEKKPEVFIAGTEPVGACPLHGGGGQTLVSGWDQPAAQQSSGVRNNGDTATARRADTTSAPAPLPYQQNPSDPAKKKGFLNKLKSVFK